MKSVLIALALALALPALPAMASPSHCPSGLAKKSPACIPPGQAKKMRGQDVERWEYDLERERRLTERERRRLERERERLRAERLRLEEERRRAEWERLYGDRTAVWTSPRPRPRADLPYRWPAPRGEQWVRYGELYFRVDEQGRPIVRLPTITDLLSGIGN